MSLRPKPEYTDSKPYIVWVRCYGTTVEEIAFATFPDALEEYRRCLENYTGRWHDVSIYNDDRADGGWPEGDDGPEWVDGLTEDECEAVADAYEMTLHPELPPGVDPEDAVT